MSDLKLATTDYVDTHSSPGYERISENDNSLYIQGPVNISNALEISNKTDGASAILEPLNGSIYVNGPLKVEELYDKNGQEITAGGGGTSYQYIEEYDTTIGIQAPTVYLGGIGSYVNIGDMGASQIEINGPVKFNDPITDKNGLEITSGLKGEYVYISDTHDNRSIFKVGPETCGIKIDSNKSLTKELVINAGYIGASETNAQVKLSSDNGDVTLKVTDSMGAGDSSLDIASNIPFKIKHGQNEILSVNNWDGVKLKSPSKLDIECANNGSIYINGPTTIMRGKIEMPLGISDANEFSDIRGVKFKSNNFGYPTVEFHDASRNRTSLYVNGPVKFVDDIFDKNGEKITAGGDVSDLIHTEPRSGSAKALIVGNNQNSTFITGPYIGIGDSNTKYGVHIPGDNSNTNVYLGVTGSNNTIFINGPTIIQTGGVRLDLDATKLQKLKDLLS